MSESATKSYDRRTANGKSFYDYLKRAQAEFLAEVGRNVNARQKYCTCKVRDGISVSFLIVEGTDSSDFDLEGAVSIITVGDHDVVANMDFDSAHKGKIRREHRTKVGVMTVDLVADMILEIIGVRE